MHTIATAEPERAGITAKRRKILFLVTEDWFFLSHRLCLGKACHERGWDVVVATRVTDGREAIEKAGLRVVPLAISRGGTNPIAEMITLFRIVGIYRRERPDVVHHVAMKPVIYGSIAAMLSGRPIVVNALAGMGYLFTAGRSTVRLMRGIVLGLFRFCLRGGRTWLIVQNSDDAEMFAGEDFVPAARLTLIRGSGVDPERFHPSPEPRGRIVAVIVARMLKDKGIVEAVEAARELKRRKTDVCLHLVGDPDPENPSSIAPETLRQWQREGVIKWLGHRTDIADIWAQAHIAVLPSHREGLPKSLIEAAACGRPMIATDVPGCREIVRHGENGLLVPPRDAMALADAIETLAKAPETRQRMGAAARADVERLYCEEKVVRATLDLYDRAIAAAG